MKTFSELLKEFRNLDVNDESALLELGMAHKALPQSEKN